MIPEVEYHKLVAAWLAESFSYVEHEVILPSRRRPDFVAYTPFGSYIIEVENSWQDIKDGLGQCRMYAAETGFEPVLILPADDVQWDELESLQNDECAPHIETV